MFAGSLLLPLSQKPPHYDHRHLYHHPYYIITIIILIMIIVIFITIIIVIVKRRRVKKIILQWSSYDGLSIMDSVTILMRRTMEEDENY